MKKGIDSAWFLKRLEEKGLSVRELAGRLTNRQGNPMDRGNLWRLLHNEGPREMTVRELGQLVEVLDLDPCEAFARARGRKH